jgi:hypothetical protein
MRALLAALCVVPALGCTISPVVTTPDVPGSRYSDCQRASEAYCEHVVDPRSSDRERCVAEHVYQCVSACASPGAAPAAPARPGRAS